ncbi:hypothetical protein [Streptomyces sp. NPDC004629]|uniref:hypothetical protein n=1 Tax=Streptomyces sp. NPDC004629 TaxID=3364705 RepID=UPI00369000E3
MSRWNGRPARRRAAGGAFRAERERPAATAPGPVPGAEPRVLVEDHDGLLLLRLPTDDTLLPADVADLARALRAADDGTVTIAAVAEGDAATALWPRLSESLDSLRDTGTRSVRLVMSGAGHDRTDRPALARRIAESWDVTVEAPDGPVLVVPGGSVFVPPGDGGWWRFAAGQEPELLGPRTPAPDWQAAVRRTPVRTADGCVVDQIPAGLLIRPAEAGAPRPGDLFHAIPVDPRRLAVIVGVPWGEDVVATDVAELLGALPAAVRPGVRLVPGGRRDLLPLGQSVAALLNAEVEVTTGLPLFAADGPLGTYRVRSVLVGPDGEPRWLPFVDAVMCLPAREPAPGPDARPAQGPRSAPAPRLLRWSSPVPDLGASADGAIGLSDAWQAVVTRAGLWVGPRDGTPPPRSARQVSIEGPVIEVGRVGDRLDASLWPVLSRFLGRLAPDLRARTTLDVQAAAPDGGRALRILAAEHALRVIRFAPAARTAPPARRDGPAVRTGGPAGGPVNGPVQRAGSRPVPPPLTAAGAAGETVAAGAAASVPDGSAAVAVAVPGPDGPPRPPKPSRVPVTATGGTGTGPAAPGRPATVSGGDPAGGSSEPTLSPVGPAPEPKPEPVSVPVSTPVSAPVAVPVSTPVSEPSSAPLADPVAQPSSEPSSAASSETSPEVVVSTPEAVEPVSGPASGPASAPRTPRRDPVAVGAPAAPIAPARPVPTAGGAVPRPPSPPETTVAPRAEAPRTEAPRTAEAPRTETRTEAPRTEIRPEAPRTETRTEAPRTEIRPEAPRTEVPRKPDDGGAAPAPAPAVPPPAGTGGGRPLPAVPVPPRHRSTTPERDSFRRLAEPVWERHSAAVNRALAGMPALRGEEQEAARTDLIALRMYLHNGEGPLGPAELTRSLRAGEQRLVPYAGCLASGLGRLPSYRGAVLRGGTDVPGLGGLRPGDVLRDPAPLSGLPLDPAGKDRVAGVGFAIWSITGRRVRQLLDGGDEVVFAPGTAFKVLDVRTDAASRLVLLRQLPDTQAVSAVLEDADDTALARLDHALTDRTAPGAGDWPGRCAGPVGGPDES